MNGKYVKKTLTYYRVNPDVRSVSMTGIRTQVMKGHMDGVRVR